MSSKVLNVLGWVLLFAIAVLVAVGVPIAVYSFQNSSAGKKQEKCPDRPGSGRYSLLDRFRDREAFVSPSAQVPNYLKELALFQSMGLKEQQEYLSMSRDQKSATGYKLG
jgi:hypothetical protein